MKAEVKKITRGDKGNINVVWEYSNGERERFTFPPGEGWDEENAEGELSCVARSRKKIRERFERQEKSNDEFESLKKKHEGRAFDLDKNKEITSQEE